MKCSGQWQVNEGSRSIIVN